jgi:hypothetical protein
LKWLVDVAFSFTWSRYIHIEKMIHIEVCRYHCLASSDESGDFVVFGQDPLGETK